MEVLNPSSKSIHVVQGFPVAEVAAEDPPLQVTCMLRDLGGLPKTLPDEESDDFSESLRNLVQQTDRTDLENDGDVA